MERELACRGLRHFVPHFWRSVETAEYSHNWHIDAISEHLEAVSRGQITRLIINIPPRHMKSLLMSVLWPAWDWLAVNGSRKFLFASYAQNLSIRDSVKCRRIVDNVKYQRWIAKQWDGWRLTSDQNTKERYDNSLGGYRLATSVGGALTGEGGDIIGVDDAHNVMQVESPVQRDFVLKWWDEAMSSRLNDPKTGAYVLTQQRTHENDLIGHILEKEKGWVRLILPARYEKGHNRIVSPGFTHVDPREDEGEPLWPDRFGDAELTALEEALGAYATAAQLQQRPAPRQGGMFPRDKFKILEVNEFVRENIVASIRYWDKAATSGAGCYSAGSLMHKMKDKSIVIEDVQFGHWDALKRERWIKATAERDGHNVTTWHEQEPGSGGKESAEATTRNLAGFRVYADRVSGQGSKPRRAEPYAAQVQAGNAYIIRGAWNNEFLNQHEMFPNGKFVDIPDSCSGAYNKHFVNKVAGVWGTAPVQMKGYG